MARPSKHTDLDEYQRQGNTIFTWYSSIAEHPEVEQHIVKAKLEARRLGYEITGMEVRVPLSTKELDSKLADQQARYDRGEKIYHDLELGPQVYADLTYSERGAVDYFAQCDELVAPEKLPLPAEV